MLIVAIHQRNAFEIYPSLSSTKTFSSQVVQSVYTDRPWMIGKQQFVLRQVRQKGWDFHICLNNVLLISKWLAMEIPWAIVFCLQMVSSNFFKLRNCWHYILKINIYANKVFLQLQPRWVWTHYKPEQKLLGDSQALQQSWAHLCPVVAYWSLCYFSSFSPQRPPNLPV